MKSAYIFREIRKDEVAEIFSMILERMRWMDKKGINQWNTSKYDEIYPESYYEEKRQKGELFVLTDPLTGEILCAAVLKEKDDRWNDSEPSLYLHNFVSKIDQKNAGTAFLQYAEAYAAKKGKKYLRLDSMENNTSLAQYYEKHGFVPVGTCQDGLYKGILRQKELSL